MPNNYLQFCVGIDLPPEAAQYALTLASLVSDLYQQRLENPDAALSDDERFTEAREIVEANDDNDIGALFEINPDGGIYVTAEDYGNPDMVADILQHVMRRFDIDKPIVIEWAVTCSRMVVDEFGGGCVIVTKDGTQFMTTGQWARNKIEKSADDAVARIAQRTFDELAAGGFRIPDEAMLLLRAGIRAGLAAEE